MQVRGYQNIKDTIEDNWLLKVTAWLFFMGSLVGLISVSIINLRPYVILMGGLPTGWLFQIPLLGVFFKAIAGACLYIGSILIWSVIQYMQIFWFLVQRSVKARKAAVRQSIAITAELEKEAAKSNDPRQFKGRIKSASKVPFQMIKWSVFMALAAYTFDLVVGLRVYPAFADWNTFDLWLKSFNPMWINQGNALDLGIMMFSFELLFVMVVLSWDWIQSNKNP